jgi:hypothetical protein
MASTATLEINLVYMWLPPESCLEGGE